MILYGSKSSGFRTYSFVQRSISSLLTIVFFATAALHTYPAKAQSQETTPELGQKELFIGLMKAKQTMCKSAFPMQEDPEKAFSSVFRSNPQTFWKRWQNRLDLVDAFLNDYSKKVLQKNTEISEVDENKFSCASLVWTDLMEQIAIEAKKNQSCFPQIAKEIHFTEDYRICEGVYLSIEQILNRVLQRSYQTYSKIYNDLIFRDEQRNDNEIQQEMAITNLVTGSTFQILNSMFVQVQNYRTLYFNPSALQQIFEASKEANNDYDAASPYLANAFSMMEVARVKSQEKLEPLVLTKKIEDAPKQTLWPIFNFGWTQPEKEKNENTINVTFAKQVPISIESAWENPELGKLDASILKGLTLSSMKQSAFQIWGDILWKYGSGYFQGWQNKVPEDKLTEEQKATGKTYYYGQYRSEYDVAFSAFCSYGGEFGETCKKTKITLDHGITIPLRQYVKQLFDEFATQQDLYGNKTEDERINKRSNPALHYAAPMKAFNFYVSDQQKQCHDIYQTIQKDKDAWNSTLHVVDYGTYADVEDYDDSREGIEKTLGPERIQKFKSLYQNIIKGPIGSTIQDEELREQMHYEGYEDDLTNCARKNETWNLISIPQAIAAQDRIRNTQYQAQAKSIHNNIALMNHQRVDAHEIIADLIQYQPLAVLDFLMAHPSQDYAIRIAKHIHEYSIEKRNDVIGKRILFAFAMILLAVVIYSSAGTLSPEAVAVAGYLSTYLLVVSLVAISPMEMAKQRKENQLIKEGLSINSYWDFGTLINLAQQGENALRSQQIWYWVQLGLAPLAFIGPVRNAIQAAQAEKLLLQARNLLSEGASMQAWESLYAQMAKNPRIVFKTPNKLGGYTAIENMPVQGIKVEGLASKIKEANRIKNIIRGSSDEPLGGIDPWTPNAPKSPIGGGAIATKQPTLSKPVNSPQPSATPILTRSIGANPAATLSPLARVIQYITGQSQENKPEISVGFDPEKETKWKNIIVVPLVKTQWQLLQEALSGQILLEHKEILKRALEACNQKILDTKTCAQITQQIQKNHYAELKTFSIQPEDFIRWTKNLKYTVENGEIVKNPFTNAEIQLMMRMAESEFAKAIEKDPFAQANKAHMDEHMMHVEKYKSLIESLGIDFEYYKLLVFLHDSGKYIPSQRVLDLAKGNIILGRVVWHDQSTAEYLLHLGQKLLIDPAKIEHLIADIIGHNDGSQLKGIFWNNMFPGYPLPNRLEGDLLALFDRFGQGNWTGARKILPQTVQETFFDKVENAFFTNPNDTIEQLKIIYQRAQERLKEREHSKDAEKNLQEMFEYAVTAQQETLRGYNQLEWNTDRTTSSISDNERSYNASNVQEFLRPDFQQALEASTFLPPRINNQFQSGPNQRPAPKLPRQPNRHKKEPKTPPLTKPKTAPDTKPNNSATIESVTIQLPSKIPLAPETITMSADFNESENKSNQQKALDLIFGEIFAYDIDVMQEICRLQGSDNVDIAMAAQRYVAEHDVRCVYAGLTPDMLNKIAQGKLIDDLSTLKLIRSLITEYMDYAYEDNAERAFVNITPFLNDPSSVTEASKDLVARRFEVVSGKLVTHKNNSNNVQVTITDPNQNKALSTNHLIKLSNELWIIPIGLTMFRQHHMMFLNQVFQIYGTFLGESEEEYRILTDLLKNIEIQIKNISRSNPLRSAVGFGKTDQKIEQPKDLTIDLPQTFMGNILNKAADIQSTPPPSIGDVKKTSGATNPWDPKKEDREAWEKFYKIYYHEPGTLAQTETDLRNGKLLRVEQYFHVCYLAVTGVGTIQQLAQKYIEEHGIKCSNFNSYSPNYNLTNFSWPESRDSRDKDAVIAIRDGTAISIPVLTRIVDRSNTQTPEGILYAQWLRDFNTFLNEKLDVHNVNMKELIESSYLPHFEDKKLQTTLANIRIFNEQASLDAYIAQFKLDGLVVKLLLKNGKIKGWASYETFYRFMKDKLNLYSMNEIFKHPEIKALHLTEYETWAMITGTQPLLALFQDYQWLQRNMDNLIAVNQRFSTQLLERQLVTIHDIMQTTDEDSFYKELFSYFGTTAEWPTANNIKEIQINGVRPSSNDVKMNFSDITIKIKNDPQYLEKLNECLRKENCDEYEIFMHGFESILRHAEHPAIRVYPSIKINDAQLLMSLIVPETVQGTAVPGTALFNIKDLALVASNHIDGAIDPLNNNVSFVMENAESYYVLESDLENAKYLLYSPSGFEVYDIIEESNGHYVFYIREKPPEVPAISQDYLKIIDTTKADKFVQQLIKADYENHEFYTWIVNYFKQRKTALDNVTLNKLLYDAHRNPGFFDRSNYVYFFLGTIGEYPEAARYLLDAAAKPDATKERITLVSNKAPSSWEKAIFDVLKTSKINSKKMNELPSLDKERNILLFAHDGHQLILNKKNPRLNFAAYLLSNKILNFNLFPGSALIRIEGQEYFVCDSFKGLTMDIILPGGSVVKNALYTEAKDYAAKALDEHQAPNANLTEIKNSGIFTFQKSEQLKLFDFLMSMYLRSTPSSYFITGDKLPEPVRLTDGQIDLTEYQGIGGDLRFVIIGVDRALEEPAMEIPQFLWAPDMTISNPAYIHNTSNTINLKEDFMDNVYEWMTDYITKSQLTVLLENWNYIMKEHGHDQLEPLTVNDAPGASYVPANRNINDYLELLKYLSKDENEKWKNLIASIENGTQILLSKEQISFVIDRLAQMTQLKTKIEYLRQVIYSNMNNLYSSVERSGYMTSIRDWERGQTYLSNEEILAAAQRMVETKKHTNFTGEKLIITWHEINKSLLIQEEKPFGPNKDQTVEFHYIADVQTFRMIANGMIWIVGEDLFGNKEVYLILDPIYQNIKDAPQKIEDLLGEREYGLLINLIIDKLKNSAIQINSSNYDFAIGEALRNIWIAHLNENILESTYISGMYSTADSYLGVYFQDDLGIPKDDSKEIIMFLKNHHFFRNLTPIEIHQDIMDEWQKPITDQGIGSVADLDFGELVAKVLSTDVVAHLPPPLMNQFYLLLKRINEEQNLADGITRKYNLASDLRNLLAQEPYSTGDKKYENVIKYIEDYIKSYGSSIYSPAQANIDAALSRFFTRNMSKINHADLEKIKAQLQKPNGKSFRYDESIKKWLYTTFNSWTRTEKTYALDIQSAHRSQNGKHIYWIPLTTIRGNALIQPLYLEVNTISESINPVHDIEPYLMGLTEEEMEALDYFQFPFEEYFRPATDIQRLNDALTNMYSNRQLDPKTSAMLGAYQLLLNKYNEAFHISRRIFSLVDPKTFMAANPSIKNYKVGEKYTNADILAGQYSPLYVDFKEPLEHDGEKVQPKVLFILDTTKGMPLSNYDTAPIEFILNAGLHWIVTKVETIKGIVVVHMSEDK